MKLPAWLQEPTIENMKVGDRGYAVPWSLSVGKDEQVYLNGGFAVSEYPAGTRNMRVYRSEKGYEVYVVDGTTIDPTPSDWAGTKCPVVSITDGNITVEED